MKYIATFLFSLFLISMPLEARHHHSGNPLDPRETENKDPLKEGDEVQEEEEDDEDED